MAIPQWTGRQSLAQPNINPTAAIEGASRAFGNISDTLQKEQLAKQEEEYRRQQMAIQQEQVGLQQAARLSQNKQFDKQFGLQEQQFLFNKGAGDRATQARIAEEARIRNQNATRYKLFSDKANELENQQLAGFTLHPDTLAALKANNMSDEQIAAVVANTKQKNADVFLDRNKVLSGLMDHAASTGEDLSNYAPLLSAYQAKSGMGGADPKAVAFAEKLALANARSGGGGSGGGVDPTAGFTAIDNEKLFKDGSDAFFKEMLPGQRHKVYKEDVRRIAEHAHITKGVDPRFVVAAIKADMDDGQTNYTLSKMNTDENDKGYQGILAAAELMQNRAKKGVNSTASGGGLGSAEFALGLSRGYQPVTAGQRKDVLLDESNQTFPDLFKKATQTQSSTGTEQGQTPVSEQSVNDPDKRKLIFNLAKEVANQNNVTPGQMVMGPQGQFAPSIAPKSPEQKELSSLVKLMEQKPKPNVDMPNTQEFKLFPERWKNPNPAIDAENAKLLREQEKATEKMFKILSKDKNMEKPLSPLAKWAKEASIHYKPEPTAG